ncbi:hypothetical protein N665_1401s0014 [Sinapis alba]|nr:hypothetical protein N665_1401s0014 [Sinapis alba]
MLERTKDPDTNDSEDGGSHDFDIEPLLLRVIYDCSLILDSESEDAAKALVRIRESVLDHRDPHQMNLPRRDGAFQQDPHRRFWNRSRHSMSRSSSSTRNAFFWNRLRDFAKILDLNFDFIPIFTLIHLLNGKFSDQDFCFGGRWLSAAGRLNLLFSFVLYYFLFAMAILVSR